MKPRIKMEKSANKNFVKPGEKVLNQRTTLSSNMPFQQENLVSLLPAYTTPTMLLFCDGMPCHGSKIACKPIEYILREINRKIWDEGLYVRERDLSKIIRYKNPDGNYKNDFDTKQFVKWINTVENNTALCEMENESLGKGVFVFPGKKIPRGTFIPSSGIIKLDPTIEELETKIHCSALQNLNSSEKQIVGFVDPENRGGILNFINHAPDKEELENFNFKESFIKENVATSNLRSIIKFYNGYAIMGLEAFEDIHGGEHGRQLLWSYARSIEYLLDDQPKSNKKLILFDKRDEHNGEIIDANVYALRKIDIFIDTGELILRKIASLTRWELMEKSPESGLTISTEDVFSIVQLKTIQSLIPHKIIQSYLKQNPDADRIILQIQMLKELEVTMKG